MKEKNITITIANHKLISTKVNSKQTRGSKSILYKNFYYQLPRNSSYSLELFLNQFNNLKKYKAIFMETEKEEYICVFINSTRATIIIEKIFLNIQLKRIIETVGDVCFINSLPEGIEESKSIELVQIKKIPNLVDPFKSRADRRKAIFLSIVFFFIYFTLNLLENSFNEEEKELNINITEVEHRLESLRNKYKILNNIPDENHKNIILENLIKEVDNEK